MISIELAMAVVPIIGSIIWSSALVWRHIDSQFDFLREKINGIEARAEIQYERTKGEVALVQEKINNLELLVGQVTKFLGVRGFIQRSETKPD